ncbi:MAG: adenylate kinase [Asgard group archaeon]|nr:adenylate kinase [Asgard group archaeon]
MSQGKIAIVGGVPGVGKTTVINNALEIAKKENFAIETFVYGSVMMEIAKEEYNVQHRDHLRTLSAEVQKDIQRKAALKIAERAAGKVTIVDTHYTIKTGAGSFLQGIPSWVSDSLQANMLILIEADVEEISLRRSSDDSRKRDEDPIDVLREHQLINKTVASTICQKTGALLAVVKNKQEQADIAGQQLFNHLKSLTM